MATLLWKHGKELLKWFGGLTQFKLDIQLITTQQVAGKWRIMVGIVPIPRATALVIIFEHPSQAFDISLHDILLEILELQLASDMELLGIVPFFPSFFTKFDVVLVGIHMALVFFSFLFLHDV